MKDDYDTGIYSPEESDGKTDWVTIIGAVLVGLVVVLFFLIVGACFASAATLCGKRVPLLKAFAANAKEEIHAIGLAPDGSVVEILTSKDGATWTALITSPDGATSCVTGTGTEWIEIAKKKGEPS